MERPTFKPIGTPAEELDTPALVIDLDALEANVAAVHAAVGASGASARPRLDAHLCPAIGHIQRAAPATSGAAVATLAQAETFAQYGFDDILIVNLLATRVKTGRAAALARRVRRLIVSADSARNISDLSGAASAAGSTLAVAVAVRDDNPSFGATSDAAPDLARRVSDSPGLELAGLVAVGDAGPMLRAADACARAGIETPMLAAGGSASYDTAPASGVTDVLAGSYALGDAALLSRRPELAPAARILATVMSDKDDGLVWIDAGQKATSIDTGLPSVYGGGAAVPRMSAEHGALVGDAPNPPVGSKIWLVPHNIANTANVYDYIHATRNGALEAVWEVSARGKYN